MYVKYIIINTKFLTLSNIINKQIAKNKTFACKWLKKCDNSCIIYV